MTSVKNQIKQRLEHFKKTGHGTPEQRANRMAETGADDIIDNPSISQVVSPRFLKQLTEDQLINQLVSIDAQATLMRWQILWELRQRFPSNIAFGQYLADLKNKTVHALCVDGQQQAINRDINAGRFCERFGITDLTELGLSKTVIYELSRPANEVVAETAYKVLKKKVDAGDSVSVAEAKSTIETAKSLDPRYIPQRDPITISTDQPKTSATLTFETTQNTETERRQPTKTEQAIDADDTASNDTQRIRIAAERQMLRLQLLEMDASGMSNDEIIDEIKFFIRLHQKQPFIRLIRIFQELIKWLTAEIKELQHDYPKPVSHKDSILTDQSTTRQKKR